MTGDGVVDDEKLGLCGGIGSEEKV